MKYILSLVALVLCWGQLARAQLLDFDVSTDTYMHLEGSTSLNDGMTWDDPIFPMPIGFDYEFLGVMLDSIRIGFGVGGILTPPNIDEGIMPIFVPFGVDIIDRGYDVVLDMPTEDSESNISYLVDGPPGSRIFKIEWRNAGFYDDLFDDSISQDYINFQVWLYEGSNDFEIRFGPKSISQPSFAYNFETGAPIGIFPQYSIDHDSLLGPSLLLSGNPASPDTNWVKVDQDLTFLGGTVPEGTVYTFSAASIAAHLGESRTQQQIKLYPNPARDFLQLESSIPLSDIQRISIHNAQGQLIRRVRADRPQIEIADLTKGLYFLQVQTTRGGTAHTFVKK